MNAKDQGSAPPGRRAAIIGAGPAGNAVSALLTAAGVAHTIFDEAARTGGNIDRRRFDSPPSGLERRGVHGASIEFALGTAVLSVNGDLTVTYHRHQRTRERRFDAVFLCTGAYDLALPTRGRSPRWSSAGALQALLKGQGIVPAGRVVIAGAGPFLHVVGAGLVRAGAVVSDIVDSVRFTEYAELLPFSVWQPRSAASFMTDLATLRRAGVRLRFGTTIARVNDASLILADGNEVGFDHLGLTESFAPQTQLARTAGCDQAYAPAGGYFRTHTDAEGRTNVPGLFVCGEGQAVRGAGHARISGTLAADAWLRDSGRGHLGDARVRRLHRQRYRFRRFGERLEALIGRHTRAIPDDGWACACERVTAGEVRRAVAFGLDDLADLKIVTRAGMGNCQGRYCEPALCRLVSEAGRPPRAPLSQKTSVRPVLAMDMVRG